MGSAASSPRSGGDAELARKLKAEGSALVEEGKVRALEEKVPALEDWVGSLVKLDKAKIGVQYEKKHVDDLLVHMRKTMTQVAAELKWGLELEQGEGKNKLSELLRLIEKNGALLEKKLGSREAVAKAQVKEDNAQEKKRKAAEQARWETRRGWGAALAKGGVEAAYERVVAAALYTHGMTCQKCKQKKEKEKGDYCNEAGCDQLVSLYRVMNAAMRAVGEWDEKKADKKAPTQEVQLLLAFQPLVVRLLGLQQWLPKNPQVVFRGVTLNLSPQYKVGGQKVWHGFSSTSLARGEAANFVAEGGQRGTMFAVATHKQAVDIDFANLYGERELLYAPNTVFNVAWKLSPTLLRMLGLQYDVIVLTESSSKGGADAEKKKEAEQMKLRLSALRDVMAHTVEFFRSFLSRYVEGRVAAGKQAKADEKQMLSKKVNAWLSEGKKGGRPPLCLLGGGGTGKTSAAVALMGWLLSGTDGGGGPVHVPKGNSVFPVFVPLPVLRMKKKGLLVSKGIDEYVRESFGLTAAEQKQLQVDYDVVLVLDSLDEVGIGARELVGAKGETLLSRNPWCASCSVVVTTRGEYLEAGGLVPANVCGDGTKVLYLQPFTHDDVGAYVRKVLSQDAAAKPVPKGEVDQALKALKNEALQELVSNPFVLHMALVGRNSLPWMKSGDAASPAPVMRVQVYETYLQEAVKDGLARLKLKEPKMEDVLAVGELLGCWMLGSGAWAGTVKDARSWLKEKAGDLAKHLEVCLQCLPVRLESLQDEHGTFTFTHKTIGEYLAARRLWRAPRVTLEKLLASCRFSKEAPNVLGFFAAMRLKAIYTGTDTKSDAVLGPLLGLVRGSAAPCKEEAKKVLASNAMSLLCHGRYALSPGTSLKGVEVCRADLRHLVLTGVDLTDAVLRDNWFDGSTFHSCDLTGTNWEGSSLGAVLPPMKERGSVQALTVTLDGQRVVSGSNRDPIHVWDLETGKEVMAVRKGQYGGRVDALALTPDGQRLVSGCSDKTIRIWDLKTVKAVMEPLQGHSGCVTTLAVTPDGQKIVSGSDDKTIRVWDIKNRKQVMELKGHSDAVTSLAVTPDGQKVVSGSADKTTRVWDLKTGKAVKELKGHGDAVRTVAVTPDGRKIVSGGDDKTIRVWDLATGKAVMEPLKGHSDCVTALAVTPDGRRVVSGSDDTTIRVWDIELGNEVMQPLRGHIDTVLALAVTPDGRKVASGSADDTIRVWDLATVKDVHPLDAHSGMINAVAVTTDGRGVISASTDETTGEKQYNTIRVWDLATGHEVMQPLQGVVGSVAALSVAGRRLVSGGSEKTIRVWDLKTGKEVMNPLKGHGGAVRALAVAPDGQKVVSGSDDKTVCVWDLKTGKVVKSLKGHGGAVQTVCLTPDGRKAVSGSADKTIRVWDIETGKEVAQLKGHSDAVTTLAVTSDGQKLVSGSDDHTIRVWDINTGKAVMTLKVGSCVKAVAVAPDGRIVSGSFDRKVRLWDPKTGKEVMQAAHNNSVQAVAVTPDGKIVSGSSDETIRAWDASSAKKKGSLLLLAVWGKATSLCRVEECENVESAEPEAQRELLEVGENKI